MFFFATGFVFLRRQYHILGDSWNTIEAQAPWVLILSKHFRVWRKTEKFFGLFSPLLTWTSEHAWKANGQARTPSWSSFSKLFMREDALSQIDERGKYEIVYMIVILQCWQDMPIYTWAHHERKGPVAWTPSPYILMKNCFMRYIQMLKVALGSKRS